MVCVCVCVCVCVMVCVCVCDGVCVMVCVRCGRVAAPSRWGGPQGQPGSAGLQRHFFGRLDPVRRGSPSPSPARTQAAGPARTLHARGVPCGPPRVCRHVFLCRRQHLHCSCGWQRWEPPARRGSWPRRAAVLVHSRDRCAVWRSSQRACGCAYDHVLCRCSPHRPPVVVSLQPSISAS